MTPSSRTISALAAVVGGAVLVGCGDDAGVAGTGAASFAPVDTPLYLEISRESSTQIANAESLIAELGEVPLLGSTLDPRDLIQQAIDAAAADAGVDASFAEDIEPWLGDTAGLAVLSLQEEAATGSPPFVFSLETSDEGIASDSIERLVAAGPGTDIEEVEIGGVTFLRGPGEEGGIGISDGHVLLGDSDASLEVALDAHSGDSLASDEDFTQALATLPEERLGTGFVDLEALAEAVAADEGASMDQVNAVDAALGHPLEVPLGLALTAGDRSLALDISGSPALSLHTGESSLVPSVPADAVGVVGVRGYGPQILDYVTRIDAVAGDLNEPGFDVNAIEEAFERQFGVPIGEAAEAFGDAAVYARGQLPNDYVVGIQIALPGDSEAPLLILDAIGQLLKDKGFVIGPPLDASESGFSGADKFGVVDDLPPAINAVIEDEVMTILLASSPDAMESPPEGSITDSQLFQAASAAVGEDAELGAFVDLGPILDYAIDGGSLADVVTGEATPEAAIAGFLAGKLGFAALGSGEHDGRVVQRLIVGLE